MSRRNVTAVLVVMSFLAAALQDASAQGTTEDALKKPVSVVYYYRIKFDHIDEWLDIYRTNHWPIMKAEMENGHIVDFTIHRHPDLPANVGDWNLKITITYANALIAHGFIDKNREAIVESLYPDQELHHEMSGRRMELTESITSIMLHPVSTTDW